MELFHYVTQRNWAIIFGYVLFVGTMATGYFYNLTFVQLGLVDLGIRHIGLSESALAVNMALFALLTSGSALAFGIGLGRRRWSQNLTTKLRLAFGICCVELLLTVVASFIRSEAVFLVWIVMAAIAMGIGVPVTFSLTVDLIPVRDRGYVAALITGSAYFWAAVLASTWQIERFTVQVLSIMVPGTVMLGVLAFKRFSFLEILERQQRRPEFARGRFTRTDIRGKSTMPLFLLAVVAMFGIYFVDSLGFLRVIDAPVLMENTWHSDDRVVLLIIGATHVIAALIGGVLYTSLDEKVHFLWVFGIFALVQLMYVLHIRLAPAVSVSLNMTMLYATAVSLYTVLTFALWADLSTPATIARNAAIGVALSSVTATFLSTALAVQWRTSGVSLDRHLSLVASVSLLFFTALLLIPLVSVWRRPRPSAPPSEGDI